MKKPQDKINKSNCQIFWRLFFVVLIFVVIFAVIVLTLKNSKVWEKINSVEKIRNIVEKGGIFSFLIFMLLQFLQTTILQLPSFLVTMAGAIIFGRWTAFVLSFVSVLLGSLLMFWIGRKVGRKFLTWLVGKDKTDKWIERLTHGKYLFFLMMLFPLFPDDILCVVAGVTDMSFSFFVFTNILARGVGIAGTVFFGSGKVIPFHGWGLAVWAVIGLVVLILFYLSIKYQDKLDDITNSFVKKK